MTKQPDKIGEHKPMNMVEAICQAQFVAMREDESVVVLGEDVGVDGGVFRATDGLIQEFGKERVLDTPLAEGAIVGASIGMALAGLKPVCEIQFSGFIYQAFHQIEQHMSRIRQRTRGRFHVPMVCRAPYGGGIRALEHHSESREAYFAHTPGLKMVIPSTPYDAKGLLLAAINDPDPVIFYEPKRLYRALRQEIPVGWYEVPLGQARLVREGRDVTLISWGASVPVCEEAAEVLAADQIEAEIIDVRSLSPLDTQAIVESVKKTQRAVIVHEAPRSFGPGAEISARIQEKAFLYLKAPVRRVTGYDVHVPYFSMEQHYLPNAVRVGRAVHEIIEY